MHRRAYSTSVTAPCERTRGSGHASRYSEAVTRRAAQLPKIQMPSSSTQVAQKRLNQGAEIHREKGMEAMLVLAAASRRRGSELIMQLSLVDIEQSS